MLLSLYARKEPTTDSVSIMFGFKKKLDVVLYKDRECTKPWSTVALGSVQLPSARTENSDVQLLSLEFGVGELT